MQLQQIVTAAWQERSGLLVGKLLAALQYCEPTQSIAIEQAVGDMAAQTLNLAALAKVTRTADKAAQSPQEPLRKQRMTELHTKLLALRDQWQTKAPQPQIVEFKDPSQCLAACETHLSAMANVWKLLRMAWLERNAKYQPAVHDSFFETFGWENLHADELSLCPPFVVHLVETEDRAFVFQTLLPLVTAGLPVKVVLERTAFGEPQSKATLETALRCTLELEMLPIALRGLYVMQDTTARAEATDLLRKGLQSPRPAVLSLLGDPDAERCALAVHSRALPVFRYDPDASEIFLKCFDLSGNPQLGSTWATSTIEYMGEDGKKDLLEKPITFADFAAGEAHYQQDFSDLPKDKEARSLELSQWLEMSMADRAGKLPYVVLRNSKQQLVRKVPSLRIVALASAKRHLWKSLSEMAGLGNPYMDELERQWKEVAQKEREQALAKQAQEFQAQIEQAKQSAVQTAMGQLARNLLGMEQWPTNPAPNAPSQKLSIAEQFAKMSNAKASAKASGAESTPATTSEPKPATAAESAGDLPYIETKLCTACDECVTIDPRIFAYNNNKQAYIKDPKGGPYKNIQKAAARCSARIIHA